MTALVGLDSFLDPAADWGLDPPAEGGLPEPGLDGGLSWAAELGLSWVADKRPDPGLAEVGLDPSLDPKNVIIKRWNQNVKIFNHWIDLNSILF